jgi:DNA polymerase I-like protein with 3'-5' exonuclease and polymerase domains
MNDNDNGIGDVKLCLVNSFTGARKVMNWIEDKLHDRTINPYLEEKPLGFDIESTGLSPVEDRIRLFQIGDTKVGWAIPYEDWKGLVKEIVNYWEGPWVAHNAAFDWHFLNKDGITLPRHRIHDTMYMSHVLEPNRSKALKSQSARHVHPSIPALQNKLSQLMSYHNWTWANLPIQPTGPLACYWQYGALDPVITCLLHEIHFPRVMEECPDAYDLELATAWATSDMSYRGTLVDKAFTQETLLYLETEIAQIEEWCQRTYNLNPGQSAEVIKALEKEGVTFSQYTQTGRVSLNKSVLTSIEHPLADRVLYHRQAVKVCSTYLTNFLKFSEFDGFLHPNINPTGGSKKSQFESGGETGVKTSRMSMDKPNLQNVPRVD